MKKLTALLLAGMLCFTGCSTLEQADSVAETEPPMFRALPLPDLYVEIPERFSTTSSTFYEEYYICEDASIIVTQDTENPPYASVEDYSVKALNEYKSVTQELEFLSSEMIYAGTAAVQTLEFNYTLSNDTGTVEKTCLVGYMTDTESMYIITCKSDKATYQEYREDFLRVIQSARYVK